MTTEFTVGDRVRLAAQPPYFKTADPMPMLRPADTVPLGAEGVILSRRPGGYWGIKFDKGSFLVDSQFLEQTETSADQATEAAD
ncbi:MAG: DUF3148 domain-containing protein [Shackletoniella antarctica]|uniref:DUF3148 domain-containing protein n=1 Tax=Shackletoniella antarctica TaxID=268115 RepID=A0A2W4WF67_9CYAN|nr:MAG: DUF3148 domain-containing protein [Shackletoniella antarctica]